MDKLFGTSAQVVLMVSKSKEVVHFVENSSVNANFKMGGTIYRDFADFDSQNNIYEIEQKVTIDWDPQNNLKKVALRCDEMALAEIQFSK